MKVKYVKDKLVIELSKNEVACIEAALDSCAEAHAQSETNTYQDVADFMDHWCKTIGVAKWKKGTSTNS